MQRNETQLTRRKLGMICAAQVLGATTMQHTAFAGGYEQRHAREIGKIDLTRANCVSRYEAVPTNVFIALALTLFKTGDSSPDTAKLKIRLNIEQMSGASIYDKTLRFRFWGNELRNAAGRSEDGEHIILVDHPRLRDLLKWERYIFTVTTIVPIPNKGLDDQFLSLYEIAK